MIYITVYRVTREYGGPEEGGWWYDAGEVLESINMSNDEEDAENQISVNVINYYIERFKKSFEEEYDAPLYKIGGSDLKYTIGTSPGKNYPTRRPHYE
jgi:hypothetical protein